MVIIIGDGRIQLLRLLTMSRQLAVLLLEEKDKQQEKEGAPMTSQGYGLD